MTIALFILTFIVGFFIGVSAISLALVYVMCQEDRLDAKDNQKAAELHFEQKFHGEPQKQNLETILSNLKQ